MSREVEVTIVDASYHRNGVCGVGFYAVLFDDKEHGRMIASIFDDIDAKNPKGYCAVYSVPALADGNIAFAGGNSWRGDVFESELIPALREWLKAKGSNRIGPFAMPDPRD